MRHIGEIAQASGQVEHGGGEPSAQSTDNALCVGLGSANEPVRVSV